MEAVNTVAGQMNPMPFQIGAVLSGSTKGQQGVGSDCSPFMASLQKMLTAADGQHDQEQIAGGQSPYTDIKAALEDLFSSPSGAACMSGQKAGQTVTNPIIAIIQQIQQMKKTGTDLDALTERLSGFMGIVSGQDTTEGPVQEPEGSVSDESDSGSVRARGVEQAILLSLTRLIQQKGPGPVLDNMGANEQGGEIGDKEDHVLQSESAEGIMARIASILLLGEKNAGTIKMPALPQHGRDSVQGDYELGNIPEGESSSRMNSAVDGTQVIASRTIEESVDLDATDEVFQLSDTSSSSLHAANGASALGTHIAIAPTLRTINDVDDSEQTTKVSDSSPKRPTDRDARSAGETDGDQGSLSQGADLKGGGSDKAAEVSEYEEAHRFARDAADRANARSSEDPSANDNSSVSRAPGQDNEMPQNARVLHSKYYERSEGDQQIVAHEQSTTGGGPKEPATKASHEVQSISDRDSEVGAIEQEPSSKSRSFTKGDGDSQQLGQGLANQRIAERPAASNGGTSTFGDIVADRIARTIEHIVQANRSDLTLRLKIDGSESVILEMKERAGTVVIGIQCQDKSLAKALENQKEMIVRNLETKNVNTSISISNAGDDEQEGQRQWQREQHRQQRHNWNERHMSSRPYFETLI